MTTAKAIFLSDKDLASWFHATVNDSRFDRAVAFADAELINEPNLTPDQLNGAKIFKRILLSLSDEENNKRAVIKPLLNQNFDKPPPKRQIKQKVTKDETPS